MLVPFVLENSQIWQRIAHVENGHISSGPAIPPSKGGGPKCSPILGVPSTSVYTLCQTYKFDVVTHMGRGPVYRGSAMPHPKVLGPALPLFGVLFHLRVHYLSQNYQTDVVTHMGKVLVFRGLSSFVSR